MSVGTMESLVAMQRRLHVILSRRHVAQTPDGIAGGGLVYNCRLPRPQTFNIHTENHLRAHAIVDLHARFLRRIGRQQEEESSVEWLAAAFSGKRYCKAGLCSMQYRCKKRKASDQRSQNEPALAKEHLSLLDVWSRATRPRLSQSQKPRTGRPRPHEHKAKPTQPCGHDPGESTCFGPAFLHWK